jgi:hypothetical protein
MKKLITCKTEYHYRDEHVTEGSARFRPVDMKETAIRLRQENIKSCHVVWPASNMDMPVQCTDDCIAKQLEMAIEVRDDAWDGYPPVHCNGFKDVRTSTSPYDGVIYEVTKCFLYGYTSKERNLILSMADGWRRRNRMGPLERRSINEQAARRSEAILDAHRDDVSV